MQKYLLDYYVNTIPSTVKEKLPMWFIEESIKGFFKHVKPNKETELEEAIKNEMIWEVLAIELQKNLSEKK